MKAVLVIDMPNDIDISKVRIGGDGNIYYMRDGERASIIGNIRNIKSLPQHREMFVGDRDRREVMLGKAYYKGWNACLEEITGEIK